MIAIGNVLGQFIVSRIWDQFGMSMSFYFSSIILILLSFVILLKMRSILRKTEIKTCPLLKSEGGFLFYFVAINLPQTALKNERKRAKSKRYFLLGNRRLTNDLDLAFSRHL